MRPGLFLDTSGWFAAINTPEARHADAKAAYVAALRGGVRLITTNLVVAELHALMLKRRGPMQALAVLEAVTRDVSHEVVYADAEMHASAIQRWIRPYRDQGFSLTDALSFEVMRQRGLRRALAIDRHFIAAGYEIL